MRQRVGNRFHPLRRGKVTGHGADYPNRGVHRRKRRHLIKPIVYHNGIVLQKHHCFALGELQALLYSGRELLRWWSMNNFNPDKRCDGHPVQKLPRAVQRSTIQDDEFIRGCSTETRSPDMLLYIQAARNKAQPRKPGRAVPRCPPS